MNTRRDFLRDTAWMGAAAFAAGCVSARTTQSVVSKSTPMAGFRCAPIPNVRVGMIGVGSRGGAAVRRLARIPGVTITAICDLKPEAVARNQKWLRDNKFTPAAHEYSGKQDSWKALCDSDFVDVVYQATPHHLHTPVSIYAMQHGKHVLVEVPAVVDAEEGWAVVETCEKERKHMMMLENTCYGEEELLMLNLTRIGKLGDLSYAECGYIHDLRERRWWGCNEKSKGVPGEWFEGNTYPTHGFGPIAFCMGINRGDQLDSIVSVGSAATNLIGYTRDMYGADSWQVKRNLIRSDMNVSLLRTKKGRLINLKFDVQSPRPYSRDTLLSGSRGIFQMYPLPVRMAWEEKVGDKGAHDWFDEKKTAEMREKYRPQVWKTMSEILKKVGGHGGKDFLMDLRWAYCLQNGLPLDMDVYDLAEWSAIRGVSKESALASGKPVPVPDYTRGAWKTVRPLVDITIDPEKMGLKLDGEISQEGQLNV